MTNITETSSFIANVPQVEITDPVLGGTAGESNAAAIALANRTRYLYDRLQGFDDIAVVSTNTLIDAAYRRKMIIATITGNITLTIDALANFNIGERLVIKCTCATVKNVSLIPTGADKFTDGNIEHTIFWLYDGEEITLVKKSAAHWELINGRGNFDIVGQDAFVRIQKRNTVIANGCTPEGGGALLNRADYARLWALMQPDAVAESTWLGAPSDNYRGLFSSGNTVSTFRIPDMRAMFMRGLDLGRGISIGRVAAVPGAYEADALKAHAHSIRTTNSAPSFNATADPIRGSVGGTANAYGAEGGGTIGSTGTTENIVKNAGFIPVIYF